MSESFRLSIGASACWAGAVTDYRCENAVVEMLKRKQAGLPPAEQPEAAAPSNVVNLMDALRRSVEAERPGRAGASKPADRKKLAKEPERRPAKGARKAG